jgi:hypothetical protein
LCSASTRIWTCTPKRKKLLRLTDAEFLASQAPDLPKPRVQLRERKLDEIELEIGEAAAFDSPETPVPVASAGIRSLEHGEAWNEN